MAWILGSAGIETVTWWVHSGPASNYYVHVLCIQYMCTHVLWGGGRTAIHTDKHYKINLYRRVRVTPTKRHIECIT